MTELLNSAFVDYKLHDIEGAKVSKYFYDHYIEDFKLDFTRDLMALITARNPQEVIFTGHSLGGAMV